MYIKLLLLLTYSISFSATKKEIYYQKNVGILNKQFSLIVLQFDKSYQRKAESIKKIYSAKSMPYKRAVDFYSFSKRKLYFQQTESLEKVRKEIKKLNQNELRDLLIGLETFEKIYHPKKYIKNFKKEYQRLNKEVDRLNSDELNLFSQYRIKEISESILRKKDFLNKVKFGIVKILKLSDLGQVEKLQAIIKHRKFQKIFQIYLVELKLLNETISSFQRDLRQAEKSRKKDKSK